MHLSRNRLLTQCNELYTKMQDKEHTSINIPSKDTIKPCHCQTKQGQSKEKQSIKALPLWASINCVIVIFCSWHISWFCRLFSNEIIANNKQDVKGVNIGLLNAAQYCLYLCSAWTAAGLVISLVAAICISTTFVRVSAFQQRAKLIRVFRTTRNPFAMYTYTPWLL